MIKNKSLLEILDFNLDDIENIYDLAQKYLNQNSQVLKDKLVINLFFENSTRTLSSFEIAAKALGANTITLPIASSSISKGESLIDTVSTLNAMKPDFMVIRHSQYGILQKIKENTSCGIINAGEGSYEHPTQALTDYFTIRNLKGKITGLTIAICGDLLHSRVARSNIRLLSMYGAKINLIAPPTLLLKNLPGISKVFTNIQDGIKDADVIMLLRIQKERMQNGCFIPSTHEYSYLYKLTKEILSQNPKIIIMHPGPINRDIEISGEIADNNSAILSQVEFGVAVRKAIFHYFT